MFPEWEFKSKVCKSPSRSIIAGYLCLYLIKSIHYEPSFYLDRTLICSLEAWKYFEAAKGIYSLHQPVTSSLRGVTAPARTLCVTPTAGFTSVPFSFFLSTPGSSLLIKGSKVHYKSTVWAQLLQADRVSGRKRHAHKQTPQSCALSLS